MINYGNLEKSKIFYSKCPLEFSYIEVPWYIPNFFTDVLKPSEGKDFRINANESLVCSGEQSLFYLYSKGLLEINKAYQAITPCFRDDNEDILHQKYFMKNELFMGVKEIKAMDLMKFIDLAEEFFKKIGFKNLEIVETSQGFDIVDSQLRELGSYGFRSISHFSYIYGTGCAEPRTSTLLNLQTNGLS